MPFAKTYSPSALCKVVVCVCGLIDRKMHTDFRVHLSACISFRSQPININGRMTDYLKLPGWLIMYISKRAPSGMLPLVETEIANWQEFHSYFFSSQTSISTCEAYCGVVVCGYYVHLSACLSIISNFRTNKARIKNQPHATYAVLAYRQSGNFWKSLSTYEILLLDCLCWNSATPKSFLATLAPWPQKIYLFIRLFKKAGSPLSVYFPFAPKQFTS